MDWSLAMEENRQALKRIAAMLLALADLADRLAGLPWPGRRLALWIFRPAEAIAREFVLDELQAEGVRMSLRQGRPENALQLSLSFRVLASTLSRLSARIGRRIRRQARSLRLAGRFDRPAPRGRPARGRDMNQWHGPLRERPGPARDTMIHDTS